MVGGEGEGDDNSDNLEIIISDNDDKEDNNEDEEMAVMAPTTVL